MKLLESISTEENNVAQQIDDGALINFQAAGQRNGAIYGCTLSFVANKINIASGLLMIRGYRLKIESAEEVIDLSSVPFPDENTLKYVYIRVTRTANDATYSVWHSSLKTREHSDNIERVAGSFDYKIANVTFGPSGIVSVTSTIATITASPSGGGSIEAATMVPTPLLEIVGAPATSLAQSFLCLGNRGDYVKLASQYTIKFVLYRYVQKGRYRKRSGESKFFVHKTGYVIPLYDKIGWKEPMFSLEVDYTNLQTIVINSIGDFSYSRHDVIDNLFNYIDTMFYDPGAVYDEITDRMIPNPDLEEKVSVSLTTNPYFIRATRSRNGKQAEWRNYGSARQAKHNFFKFAFKAVLYEGSKAVAESPMSKSVLIRPNIKQQVKEGEATWEWSDLGDLFQITIL